MNIASNGGIGNRLRTMIGYAAVYRAQGRPMPQFIWKQTRHAPPNNDAYRIAGERIIDVDELDEDTVMVPGTIDVPLMFRTHDLPTPDRQTLLDAYGLIGFSPRVMQRAFKQYRLALHIRMTDMASSKRLDAFTRRLEIRAPSCPVHLACDDPAALDMLAKRFPVVNQSRFVDIEGSLRTTDIEDAATDMLACIRADHFWGTRESSFSQMIVRIRQYRGKKQHMLL